MEMVKEIIKMVVSIGLVMAAIAASFYLGQCYSTFCAKISKGNSPFLQFILSENIKNLNIKSLNIKML